MVDNFTHKTAGDAAYYAVQGKNVKSSLSQVMVRSRLYMSGIRSLKAIGICAANLFALVHDTSQNAYYQMVY